MYRDIKQKVIILAVAGVFITFPQSTEIIKLQST